MCAAVTSSWEEEQQDDRATPGMGIDYRTGALENHGTGGPGLASVLAVFDTLADACFASFGDGDADTLAAALAAVWAADGALRRVAAASAAAATSIRAASPRDGGAEEDNEDGAMPSSDSWGPGGEAGSSGYGMGGEWVEDSRMVGIVRSLAQRCTPIPGLPADATADAGTRAEQAATAAGGDGGGGDGSGDRGGSSTGEIRESTASEEPDGGGGGGGGSGGGGGDAWPVGALSLVELGGAVLDAVGPEATESVLAACPQLLEGMPPKVCSCGAGMTLLSLLSRTLLTVGVCWVLSGRVRGDRGDRGR